MELHAPSAQIYIVFAVNADGRREPKMKSPKRVETIVVVDEKDKRLLTQVSSNRRLSLDDEETVYQRGGPQVLVGFLTSISIINIL
jgi:hypothetical protein